MPLIPLFLGVTVASPPLREVTSKEGDLTHISKESATEFISKETDQTKSSSR